MKHPLSIVWFRLDFRLADNPALAAGVKRGAVLPVYIHAPEEESPWEPGGASRWWLHQTLEALDNSLRALGSQLVIRKGPSAEILPLLIKETGATAVYWNRRYEPALITPASGLKKALRESGCIVESFNGALLREPWEIENKSGKPFQVFTPFWRHCLAQPDPPEPLPAPKELLPPEKWPKSLPLAELELLPRINWTTGMQAAWQPGEAGATANLKQFLSGAFEQYTAERNRPDHAGTSRLSPHLHFGEVTPRQVWHALKRAAVKKGLPVAKWRESQFLTEVGWREFAHHLLGRFSKTPEEPLRVEFGRFPWRTNAAQLKAWQRGQTGFPIVDAGMRELWMTGWMHNRVRMVVASFLVKDLLLAWQSGARWFWDTLVDADLAQNTLGWQWSAGCGADAAPYFRVFNPVSQGEKFDPNGDYVRRWCPELTKLPAEWIHQPHAAPPEVLERAGVRLGKDYPKPIVDHAVARVEALKAFAQIRQGVKHS